MSKRNLITIVTKKQEEIIPFPKPVEHTAPIGSTVKVLEYIGDQGWKWKRYTVARYFKHHVLCFSETGFARCFTNWEFEARQRGRIDSKTGGGAHMGVEDEHESI